MLPVLKQVIERLIYGIVVVVVSPCSRGVSWGGALGASAPRVTIRGPKKEEEGKEREKREEKRAKKGKRMKKINQHDE